MSLLPGHGPAEVRKDTWRHPSDLIHRSQAAVEVSVAGPLEEELSSAPCVLSVDMVQAAAG